VDFGKACALTSGKRYELKKEEKEEYKKNHPHIAPDLRDGICKQSASSDIFSLGRVIDTINNSTAMCNKNLDHISKRCMHYSGHIRPELCIIVKMLTKL